MTGASEPSGNKTACQLSDRGAVVRLAAGPEPVCIGIIDKISIYDVGPESYIYLDIVTGLLIKSSAYSDIF